MKSERCGKGEVLLRLYEELNEFLPLELRKRQFACPFAGSTTIRQLLSDIRVPLRKVDLILANGESVGLSHVVGDGERISLYPVFEAFDVAAIQRIRRRPLRRVSFVVDGSLKPLAARLRDMGYDAVLASARETVGRGNRIFLTRSRGKIARQGYSHALQLRANSPSQQLAEVLARLQLAPPR